MDAQQLKYFLQICIDKNYAKAARNLFITQQALRKSMKRLEIETRSTLFYKSGESLELTQAGRCVKAHARNVINELDEMDKTLAALSEGNNESIIIASSYGVYPRIADMLINPFTSAFPNIKLKILELPDAMCENALINDDADFGFCIGPNDTNYFNVYPIEVHNICTMVNRSNPLSQREFLTMEDLREQPLAVVNDNFKLHHNFMRACEDAGVEPSIELDGGDVISVQNFSRFNGNITITVDFLAEDLRFDESVYVPLKAPGLNWTVNMLVHKNLALNDAAAKFIEFASQIYDWA